MKAVVTVMKVFCTRERTQYTRPSFDHRSAVFFFSSSRGSDVDKEFCTRECAQYIHPSSDRWSAVLFYFLNIAVVTAAYIFVLSSARNILVSRSTVGQSFFFLL